MKIIGNPILEIHSKVMCFALLLETETKQRLIEKNLACEANMINAEVTIKYGGSKYIKVNIGYSGRYMIEVSTQGIFGIKGYGTIHRGHYYGSLDSFGESYWGNYYPEKKENPTQMQGRGRSSVPKLTFAE